MSGASFLYPFLESDERDPSTLLVDLASSADRKIDESRRLIERSRRQNRDVIEAAAGSMGHRIRAGGKVLVFGNGGSACDASAFVRRLEGISGLDVRARSLAADPVVLSALSNDVGVAQVFSRQVEASGSSDDVAVGFSTSGQSENVLRGFAVARTRGLLTIAFAGYRGGALTENPDIDHCIVIESDAVHRIQEAQADLSSLLCRLVAHGPRRSEEPT